MSDLWHILVGPAFDGSPATVKVFRELGQFRWILETGEDETVDVVAYPSGFATPIDTDYEVLQDVLAQYLPGLGVPDFPDLFEEVPVMAFLLSEFPGEVLEGATVITTSDLLQSQARSEILEVVEKRGPLTAEDILSAVSLPRVIVVEAFQQLLAESSLAPQPVSYIITRSGQAELEANRRREL